MKLVNFAILFLFLSSFISVPDNITKESKSKRQVNKTEWLLSDLIRNPSEGITIGGAPEIIKYKNKRAVYFDGSDDAIFLEKMPLSGLEQFTIEVIFNPYSGGDFAQRFFHCGEVNGDRVLLELRSTPEGWYFDAFVKVNGQGVTLIEPSLLHPSDQWYHIAYIIDNGNLETWINGKKELEGTIAMAPLKGEKTSIGVRQNLTSWFKGAIYKIRITSSALPPEEFMRFDNTGKK